MLKAMAPKAAISGLLLVLTGHALDAGPTSPSPPRATSLGPEAGFAVTSSRLPTRPPPPPTLHLPDRMPGSTPARAPAPDRDAVPSEALTEVVQRYCVLCHNDDLLTAGLSLASFSVETAASTPQSAQTAEKMIAKLRAEMMPPPSFPRPAGDTLRLLADALESAIDSEVAARPNPGSRSFQRLNQVEYENAIKDLLGLDVNAGDWLPLDTYLANFDNMAVAQTLSPTLVTAYLTAANEVARLAVGYPSAAPTSRTYPVSIYASQHAWDRVEGAPYGTRGGIVVDHHFPANGEYVFEFALWAGDRARFEDLDLSVDGERVALVELEVLHTEGDFGPNWTMRTEPISIRAGQRRVAASFVRKLDGPYDGVLQPPDWSLAGTREPVGYRMTLLTHLRELTILGPHNPGGVAETATRQRIFTCRPTSAAEGRPCAREILSRLARQAYRRPLTQRDVEGLMAFYEEGAAAGGFEVGVLSGLEAILASPHFFFRIEREPAGVREGENYRLSDLDLASRLSFFLWGTPPDDELVEMAARGRLSSPEGLEAQVRRMLADPRSEALATRFAAQWLRLQDLERVRPDAFWFPYFSEQLARDMRRETELFFDDLVRENRSLMELYTADYTFVNERLARHYGIPDVAGDHFRRVSYPGGMQRSGLLGHASVLMLTSMGNRTSPVLRGKWVMEVLLGTPPPPPPPVPDLEETAGVQDGRQLTTRERLEIHRASPTCNACHQYMDPIGVALENFDVTGRWRVRENGAPLDSEGFLYDGTTVTNALELREALMKRPLPLVRAFTMNLLAYALGRRVEYYDQPAIRAIAREAEGDGYRLSTFILGVVKSDPFLMKRAEAASTDGAPQ